MPHGPVITLVSKVITRALIAIALPSLLEAAPRQEIVVTTTAELEAALSPANEGAQILVRAGEYDVSHALTVPGGATLEPQALLAGCLTDASTLCLQGGRFKVQVSFRSPFTGVNQTAPAVGITSDSGAFWFFSANNLEVLVKVLDGHAFNNKTWVFIASATNVEYTVTVSDTATAASRTYVNPAGNLASIVDLQAFAFGPPLPPPPSACPIEEGGLASCDPNGTLYEGTGVNNTSTWIGRVVDSSGVPIAGAIVSSESGYSWSAHDWCHAETTTDAQGNFTLNATGVRPSDWGFFIFNVKVAAPVGTKTFDSWEGWACPTNVGTIVLP